MANRTRPRVAIIGGGGAMGRLFARLLCTSVRELYLFDFFGSGSRPASLAKTMEDARVSAENHGWGASPVLPVTRDASSWSLGGDAVGDRGIIVLRAPGIASGEGESQGQTSPVIEGTGRGQARGPAPTDGTLVDVSAQVGAGPRACPGGGAGRPGGGIGTLLDRLVESWSDATVVYAGVPNDAPMLLPRADVVLLALGFENPDAYAATLEPYLAHLAPGSLLVDLGSTKTGPMAVLEREVPATVGLLGAHPLFGPTVSDLTGLIVAAVDPSDGRPASRWREWFLSQLAEARMIVTPTDADEHDDAMAFVQALTHFALLSLANTFVRLDRDPADLLAFRTPVFEPLLYLAARVAHLARSTPETYRAIQTFSTRPDARLAFLESAREILAAVERAGETPDPLVELFQRYGRPWSPEGRERRERQVREHFLEMGVRLVDGLNQLRQEVVAAVGEVRAVEERRTGQASRVVVGVVALDLLSPGKRDVSSRIRLRRLNLPLGSIQGAALGEDATGEDGQDLLIPLSRARLLSDDELIAWLYKTNQLVEWQPLRLRVPTWFDRDTLLRLLRGMNDRVRDQGSRVWDVRVEVVEGTTEVPGTHEALLQLAIVLHPADLVTARREALHEGDEDFRATQADIEERLRAIYREEAVPNEVNAREKTRELAREKDRLKKQRKALLDARTAQIDRSVRREARARVQAIAVTVAGWLAERGCVAVEW